MRDVAALAQVSTKTVSRVINDLPGAGAEVVERVRAAARTLGYRPNLTAGSLRRSGRRSATIGVLFEDLSNPFDAALLRAVEDRARQTGVLVLAGSSEDDPSLQCGLPTSLATRRVDGMVVMAVGGHQDALQQERERGTRPWCWWTARRRSTAPTASPPPTATAHGKPCSTWPVAVTGASPSSGVRGCDRATLADGSPLDASCAT